MKRLLIYFFYDKEGKVDRYVEKMLDGICGHTDDCMIICNGMLSPEGRKTFQKYTDQIMVRQNKGFGAGAYQKAFEVIGWEQVETYDEVIMMDDTLMGPIYPFQEMFDVMDKKDVDFWGLTLYHEYEKDAWGKIDLDSISVRLQSHFIAARKSLVKSREFQEYWNKMPICDDYEDMEAEFENVFTKHFSDCGFRWDVYIDTRDMVKYCECPMMLVPLELVKNRRCPVVTRKNFSDDYTYILNHTTGQVEFEVFKYLREHTDYDTEFILENILRVKNQTDINRCLHYDYILPIDSQKNPNLDYKKIKVGLVIHQYFEDLIPYCYEYAQAMPKESDILITTQTEEKKKKIEEVFSKGKWNSVQVVVIPNRGRDVSSLLVGAREFCKNYDYVCFMHDKKVQQLDEEIKGESFSYKCFENLLKNEIYVSNIVELFEENPRLGMLLPPPPNFADYYPTVGEVAWGYNYEGTVELAEKLGYTVDIDESKEPVAPLGTMFWFRPEALQKLFDVEWEYDDFPKEPNKTDGSLLHFIERIYAFTVQQQGYYPAWVMNAEYAGIEVDNLYFMLRELNKRIFKHVGLSNHKNILKLLEMMDVRGSDAHTGKREVQLYVLQQGEYKEKDTTNLIVKKDVSEYEFEKLSKYEPTTQIRLDPSINGGITVTGFTAKVYTDQGKKYVFDMNNIATNGLLMKNRILFLGEDPQIVMNFAEAVALEKIEICIEIEDRILAEDVAYIQSQID